MFTQNKKAGLLTAAIVAAFCLPSFALQPQAAQPAKAPPQDLKTTAAQVEVAKVGKVGTLSAAPTLASLEEMNRKAEIAAAEKILKDRTASMQVEIAPPKTPLMTASPERIVVAPAPPPPPPTSGAKVSSIFATKAGAIAELVLQNGDRYFAKAGEILAGGWRITSLDLNGVVVEDSNSRATEVLGKYMPQQRAAVTSGAGNLVVPADVRASLMGARPGSVIQQLGPRPDSTTLGGTVPPPLPQSAPIN